jgi:hypothetical protein
VLLFTLIQPVTLFVRATLDLQRPTPVSEPEHLLAAVRAGVLDLVIPEMDRAFGDIVIEYLVF